MEGCEGPCICPTIEWLKGRSFKLKKFLAGKVISEERDDPAPGPECLPALFIDNEIQVPLPVSFLKVGQTMKLLRQGAECLGKKDHIIDKNRNFPYFCLENSPGYSYDVPSFYGGFKHLESSFWEGILTDI